MSINNESNVTSNSTQNDIFAVILGFYIQTVLTYLGGLLNFICILIFIKILKQEQSNQGHLYKYLLIKSVWDCFFCVQNMPQMFYYRADFSESDSYSMQYWYIICFYFLYSLLSQLSVWFEIVASIDCVCLVSRKFQWHRTNICFWTVTLVLTLSWTAYYIPNLFLFSIEKNDKGGFYPKPTQFGRKRAVKIRTLIHTIFRDILPVFISVILNSIIFYYIRQLTVKRKQMTVRSVSTITNMASSMVKKSQKAERNKIKMMFFTSCIHIFHIPVIFWNFNIFNVRSSSFLSQLCLLSISFSYVMPIFSYAAFNSTFKRYIFKVFFWCK
jgi:hypothetical protein